MPRKRRSVNAKMRLWGIALLSPAVLVVCFSTLFPFLFNIALSFVQWDGFKKITWVGFQNYLTLMQPSSNFPNALFVTAYLAFLSTFLVVAMGLVFAFVIYRLSGKEGAFTRFVLFMPSMMSFAVIALMFRFVLNNQMGLLNSFLRAIGLAKLALPWLSEKHLVIPIMALISCWKSAGYVMLLFFAALQMIPKSHLEAAVLDGAGYLTRVRYIMLPLIAPIVKLQTVMCLIGAFKSYDIVKVLTNGGPGVASYNVPMLMLDNGFKYANFGLSAAMGCVLAVVIVVLIVLVNRFMKGENYEF